MIHIYTHAESVFGNSAKKAMGMQSFGMGKVGPCGWSFLILKGEEFTVKFSGCTNATVQTAFAMAILQALYWLADNKIDDYQIYSPRPEVTYTSTLASRIADMRPKSIVKTVPDTFSHFNESVAVKALYNVQNNKPVTFDDVDVDNNICGLQDLFSQSYLVIAKFITSRTVVLKKLTSFSKINVVFTEQEFNEKNFILMQ